MDTPAAQPESPPWWRIVLIGRKPKRTLVRILILVTTCFVLFKFVLLPIRIEGISMLPTYRQHKINFVNRLAYAFREPQRGDVVAIPMPGEHVLLMKRIVALPGETIAFHQGKLVINGTVLDEPYMKLGCDWEMPPRQLGSDEYYVVGDNRSMPQEFHPQGRSPRNRITGKVLL
jgi:signal peptidase I